MNRLIRFILFATVLAIPGLSAFAQGARINISNLDRLEPKASNVVNVDVDEKLLQIAAKFLSSTKPEEAAVKQLVMGLKGVYVRSFEFEKENEFTPADVKAISSQLSVSPWTRMVDVHSKRDGETVEVRDRPHAVELFRDYLRRHPDLVEAARRELAGRDLCCWCPLPAPGEPDVCHAALLLTVAAGADP